MAEFTERITAVCPYCHQDNSTYVHPVVSSQNNPKLSKQIVDDIFFNRKCKHCGAKYCLDFSTLYRNDEYRKTICYAHSINDYVEFATSIEETRSMYESAGLFCDVRIVRDRNDLREKTRIISKGLDDRVIEILKVWGIEHLRKDGYNKKIEKALSWVNDDETIEFAFYGEDDEICCLSITMNKYYEIEKLLGKELRQSKYNQTKIDLDWAIDFVAENNY